MKSTQTDCELLELAQGVEVLNRNKIQELVSLAEENRKNWILFFNKRNGWMLRRFIPEHTVVRGQSQYCGCALNHIRHAINAVSIYMLCSVKVNQDSFVFKNCTQLSILLL